MKTPKDYLGTEILVGDTLYVALLSGRSAVLETRIVTGFLEDGRIQVKFPKKAYSWSRGTGILQYADKTIVDVSKRECSTFGATV